MALGNDLDSKIVEIYQEYLKHQKDEKVENRVYATEKSFRKGLEDVIKLNGIVDISEFYTAIAFEIQNGNFSISSDGKIDLTSESITKAVERAKKKENKSKVVINNEIQQKNSDSEKGILGITQIKTLEDAKIVLSARMRDEDMTPERRKLSEDALAMSLSQVMEEEAASNASAEVMEFVFESNIPKISNSTGIEDFDTGGSIAFSKIIEKTMGVAAQGLLQINYDEFLKHIESEYGPARAQAVRKSFKEYDMKYLQDYSKFEPLLTFTTFHDGKTLSFIDDVIRRVNVLQEKNLLSESSVLTQVTEVLKKMELAGITITPDMIENAQMIAKDPSIVLDLSTRQSDRTQMEQQMINDNGDLLVGFIQTQKGTDLSKLYDLSGQTLSEVSGNIYKGNDSALQETMNITGTGKKSIGEIYKSAEIIFDNPLKKAESILRPEKNFEVATPEVVDVDELDAGFEADLMSITDGGVDMFDAMFAGMAEDLVFDGSTEVEHERDEEGEMEAGEDVPPVSAGTAPSGMVAEEVLVDETASKVNETTVPPVTNGPEVIEEPKAPEQSDTQPSLPKVITFADKIKKGLNDLGKKAKGIFGKIAGLFGGGNNDAGNNTGTTGTGGIAQDTKEPKSSQTPGQDFIQHVDLNFDYLKNNSTESRTDPIKPKGVDDQTQGFEVDDD